MAKRGFFAEINYQAQQAEKRKRQKDAEAARAYSTAVREREQAQKAAERALASAQRSSTAEQKAAEKEAKRLLVEARESEVSALNAELATRYDEIDTLLQQTLDVDDYINLEQLKVVPEHPRFNPGELGRAVPPLAPLVIPDAPVYREPPPPSGLAGALGGKKRRAAQVEAARSAHALHTRQWEQHVVELKAWYEGVRQQHAQEEKTRQERLAQAQAKHKKECAAREAEAQTHNDELAKLINNLAFDVPSAIEEYIGIVLANSAYPESFPVDYEYTFELASRELTMTVSVPEPSTLPTVKEYKYVKTKDEITSVQLPVKAQKDRYTSAVNETAVRTLHEVFEADRAGKIQSIALTVGVNRIAPATGLPETVPLVQVAADRDTFTTFDLSNVIASATLEHLGAALSKSPLDLTPAVAGRGVRQRAD